MCCSAAQRTESFANLLAQCSQCGLEVRRSNFPADGSSRIGVIVPLHRRSPSGIEACPVPKGASQQPVPRYLSTNRARKTR